MLIGVNGNSGAHYWSSYKLTIVVVEGELSEKVELAETPFATLASGVSTPTASVVGRSGRMWVARWLASWFGRQEHDVYAG